MNNLHKFNTFFGVLLLAIFLALPAHPATAADATSFDPTLVTVKPRLIPVGTIIPWISLSAPEDAWAWLDCDGSTFSVSQYPDLAKLYPGVLPDLRDEFLRGGTLAQIGQTAQDTTREHIHGQPSHTHTFSGRLVSGTVSGTASSQTYVDMWTDIGRSGSFSYHFKNGEGEDVGYQARDSNPRQTSGGTISGSVVNTSVAGTLSASGGDNTYKNTNSDGTSGGLETAPKHIRVRYLIRALP